jgi:hypothetical protein
MSREQDDLESSSNVNDELHDLGVDLVDQNELERSLMEKVFFFFFSLFMQS